MALRVDYVLRETGSNLRRNFSLTVASLLTVVVSLTLVGVALLIRDGVENATGRWQGDVEFIVYMNPDATQDQIDAIGAALEENPEVASIEFVDKQAAFEEYQRVFADAPNIRDIITTPDLLPTSWRVTPQTEDADVIQSVGSLFEQQPGVYQVEFNRDAIQALFDFTNLLQGFVLFAAVVLLAAAAMLILNTIRTAIFARRREIEVMKLVGATNSFIRIPFMLEGLIQGVIGAGVAILMTWLFNGWITDRAGEGESLALLANFYVSGGELGSIAVILLVAGVLVGTVGSGIAITRFLDV